MSSLARATAVMSLGTVLSRLTGVLRLLAIAYALGVLESGRLADTYNLANTAPNIIYELVLGGVLTSVFVPVFVELLEKEGKERAWSVMSGIINISLLVLTAIAALAMLLAPWIARFYTVRLEGSAAELQHEALTFLLRLLLPQIFLYGIYFMTSGLLNANKRFGPPMYTPVLNNLVVIAVFLLFHRIYGEVDFRDVTREQLWFMGLGTTAGIAVFAFALLPFARGLGPYRFTLTWRHPSVKKLAHLAVFVAGYVVANQIGYLVVQWLANGQTGGYTAYVAAFTFFMLPHGLFAVSVITALLPGMSEHAVNERWDALRSQLSTGIRATVLLVLPAAVGYFVLAEPIVRILLEYGVMTERSTELVAAVLRSFVVGLVPFSIFQLFLRSFYALQDTRTPFLINCVAVALNIAVNIPLFQLLGVRGLALGHALAYATGVALQVRALRRRIHGLDGVRIWASIRKISAAAALMGALVWMTNRGLDRLLVQDAFLDRLLVVAVPVIVGAVSYFGCARILRVGELGFIYSVIKTRNPMEEPSPSR